MGIRPPALSESLHQHGYNLMSLEVDKIETTTFQVVGGGLLVFAAGVAIGSG